MDSDLPSLYNNKLLSDITIHYGDGLTLFAHKAILSSKSKYFYAAFTGNFVEAQSKDIALEEEYEGEGFAVRVLFEHMYGQQYTLTPIDDQSPHEKNARELLFYAQVFIAGDKYDTPSLRRDITARYQSCLHQVVVKQKRPKDMCTTIALVISHIGDETIKSITVDWCNRYMNILLMSNKFCKLLADNDSVRRSLQIVENLDSADIQLLIKQDGFVALLQLSKELREGLLTSAKLRATTVSYLMDQEFFLEILEASPMLWDELDIVKVLDKGAIEGLMKQDIFVRILERTPSLWQALLVQMSSTISSTMSRIDSSVPIATCTSCRCVTKVGYCNGCNRQTLRAGLLIRD